MGGYIAQELAINHPHRVLTLTSIMSSTGDRSVGQPDAVGRRALFRAPPADSDAAVEDALEAGRLLGTPGEFDEVVERAKVRQALERAFDPAGNGRQLAAIWASPDRTESLGKLTVPCLVIHGSADALVAVSGGRATAAAVPGAKLVVVDGMGHDLPPSRWPIILREMIDHFESVTSPTIDPRILPAGPHQAAILADIAARAFDEDRARYGSGPPGIDVAERHRTVIESGVHCHTIWTGGRLAGAAYVTAGAEDGEWHLDSIFVDPNEQRHRLGSALMRFIERAHPTPHCFTLETPYRNGHLHDFYESFGYRWVGSTEPGSHHAATDPQFHLRRYRRDVADPIRGHTDAEILELVQSLRDDLRPRLDHGPHPRIERSIALLDRYEAMLEGGQPEDTVPLADSILGRDEGVRTERDIDGLSLRFEMICDAVRQRRASH
jgi:GNAT superfamily N-acetyltransferase